MSSTRQTRQTRRRPSRADDERYSRRRPQRRRSGPVANTAAPRKDNITLELPCSVRSFSEAAGIPSVKVCLTVQQLTEGGMPNINSMLEDDVVELLMEHFGIENVDIRAAETLEEKLIDSLDAEDDPTHKQIIKELCFDVRFLTTEDKNWKRSMDTALPIVCEPQWWWKNETIIAYII